MKTSHTAWTKAEQWVKTVKITMFETLEQLTELSLRQLRVFAQKINKTNPGLICKALFNKNIGRMRKGELAAAIWYCRSLIKSAPQIDETKGEKWIQENPVNRIAIATVQKESERIQWITYVGFDTWLQAEEFKYFLLDQPFFWSAKPFTSRGGCRYASQVSVRKGERTSCAWEVKAWNLDSGLLARMIEKEENRTKSAKKTENEALLAQLKSDADKYGLLITRVDFVTFSAHVETRDQKHLGVIGKLLIPVSGNNYYCNNRPGSAASRDIAIKCFDAGLRLLLQSANIPVPAGT